MKRGRRLGIKVVYSCREGEGREERERRVMYVSLATTSNTTLGCL